MRREDKVCLAVGTQLKGMFPNLNKAVLTIKCERLKILRPNTQPQNVCFGFLSFFKDGVHQRLRGTRAMKVLLEVKAAYLAG